MNLKKLNNSLKNSFFSEEVLDANAYYNSLDKVTIGNDEAYVFDNNIPANEKFLVKKHSDIHEVPLHVHTFIELSYVYSGKFTQVIDKKKITLEKGEIIIIDTNVPHKILKTNQNDIIINILFDKNYFSNNFLDNLSNKGIIYDFLVNAIFTSKNNDQYIVFHSANSSNIEHIFKQILWETYFPSLCSLKAIDSYLRILFIELVRVFKFDTNRQNKNNKHNIVNIIAYIEDNYLDITLSDVAEYFNYAPNYLSSYIKTHTNKTFTQLVDKLKLERACFLLINTEQSIYDISINSGFSNLNFFYKKFNKRYNQTPFKFRNNHK